MSCVGRGEKIFWLSLVVVGGWRLFGRCAFWGAKGKKQEERILHRIPYYYLTGWIPMPTSRKKAKDKVKKTSSEAEVEKLRSAEDSSKDVVDSLCMWLTLYRYRYRSI